MAFKEKTFWKDHPPISCPEAPSRGIEVERAFTWFSVWVFGFTLLTSLGSVYLFSQPGPVDFETLYIMYMLLIPIFVPIGTLIESAGRRYCLVEEKQWAEAEGAVRWRYVALLNHILRTPSLYDRLAPPVERDRFKYRSVVTEMPDNPVFLSVLWLGTCALPVLWVMWSNFPRLWLTLIAVVVLLLRLLWLRFCVTRSVRDFGYGIESSGTTVGSRYHFADVERATIHVDPLLCQPYLRLEMGADRCRYYNPTDDDLYLVRLVKHRMPQVERID